MQPAIFLDRDGVIIENRANYIRSWQEVTFYPQALAALVNARTSPYKLVIVTNQSAVGRGIISLEVAQTINEAVLDVIRTAGGRIDGLFMCPHAPSEQCSCRKPQPGLLLQAAESLDLELSRSILIGDAWSDLQAGEAAGVSKNILVLTGRGATQLREPPRGIGPYGVHKDLAAALAGLD